MLQNPHWVFNPLTLSSEQPDFLWPYRVFLLPKWHPGRRAAKTIPPTIVGVSAPA